MSICTPTYYHVLCEFGDDKEAKLIFSDLSKRQLRKKFIYKYRLGSELFLEGRVLSLMSVKSVQVIRTALPIEKELKKLQKESGERIDRINRESNSFKLVSVGSGWHQEDIVESGENVVSQFISESPGQGTLITRTIAFLHNAWVLRLGSGVILIIVALIIKRLWENNAL